MTVITIETLAAALGLPGAAAVDATISCVPWAGRRPAIRVDGAEVIVPDVISLTVTDGVLSDPFELLPNDGTWCWRITVATRNPRSSLVRFVTVPASGPVDFGALTQVDPTTFVATDETVTAWEAAVSTVNSAGIAKANTAIIIGPSLEEQNGGPADLLDPVSGTSLRARGWWTWMNAYLHQAFTLVRNAGVGGNRYDQMLARFDTDVLAYDSDWVFIGSPTNSVTNGDSTATITGQLTEMLDKCAAAGRRVVVHCIPPRDQFTTADKKRVVAEVNEFIFNLANTRRGVIPVDVWSPLANTSNGEMASKMTVNISPANTEDGTHYSIAAAARVGRATASALNGTYPPSPPQTANAVDPRSVIANPTFLTSGTGWTSTGGGATVTYEADTDTFGNVAVATIAANTSLTTSRGLQALEDISGGRFAVGDIVQGTVRVSWSGLVPLATGATPNIPILRVRQLTAASGTIRETVGAYFATSESSINPTGFPTSGEMTLKTWRMTIDPTCTQLLISLGWLGAASVVCRFSRLTVLKEQ